VGHGADAVLYWQWRDALNGQEQYHGAIAGPDGGPLPIHKEIAEEGRDFARAEKALAGTAPVAQVALLHSYDSRWAIDFQPHNRNYDQQEVLVNYYRPLREQRLTVDVVDATAPLASYKAVFAPSLNVISQELAQHLLEYVKQGGHLILGPRSGMKDEFNALHRERQPGPLVPALGGRVEQYYAIENSVPLEGKMGAGEATIWAEHLSTSAPNAEVLLHYGKADGWLDGEAAAITRPVGKGRITYVGALLDAGLQQKLTAWVLQKADIQPEFGPLPADVEMCHRVGQEKDVYILIRHAAKGAAAEAVTLSQPMQDLLGAAQAKTQFEMAPEDVLVLVADAHKGQSK